MKIVIFDDLLFCRQSEFQTTAVELRFFEHADEVAEVARERPDLVLMDFVMGEHRNGAEAVKVLRAAGRRERVIAISSDDESNRQMISVGADDSVPKTHVRGFLARLGKQLSARGGK